MGNNLLAYNKKWIRILSTLGFLLFLVNIEMWNNLSLAEVAIGLLLVLLNTGFRTYMIIKNLGKRMNRYFKLDFIIYFLLSTNFFSRSRILSGERLVVNWIVLILINGLLLLLFYPI